MAWLGTGLSQITGQISNFTKEVLTEGTEEVDGMTESLQVHFKCFVSDRSCLVHVLDLICASVCMDKSGKKGPFSALTIWILPLSIP